MFNFTKKQIFSFYRLTESRRNKRCANSRLFSFSQINNFQDWVEKRRSRGEPSCIDNKEMHIKEGNKVIGTEEVLNVCFANVPGNLSDQNIEISIKLVLEDQKPGLLGLAEPTYEQLSKMYFPGYKLVKGKLTGGKKFRLNVLVKDNLINCQVESFTTDVPCLLIRSGSWKFMFFYREWRKDGREETKSMEQQEDRWSRFLSRVKRIPGKLTVMGDANVCYLSEDTAHQRSLTGIREELFGFLAEKGMAQLIKEDTRRRNDERGCLDHIYTAQLKHVIKILNKNIHGWDHNTIGVELRMDAPVYKRKVITERKYEMADPEDFHRAWVQSCPEEIFETDDLDRQIEVLEFKIKHVLDKVAPEKRYVSSENYAPWVDHSIKVEMRARDKMRREATAGRLDWATHDKKKAEVKHLLRDAENKWKEKYLNFSDEKTGWRRLKLVSGLTQSGDKKIALMIDGELVDDPEVLCEYMNKYFVEKIEKITEACPPDPIKSVTYSMEYFKDKKLGRFSFKPCSYRFIKQVIMRLNNVDSTGMDGIPVIVYKRFRHTLTPALTRIINNSIEQGVYPQRFRDGVISPVPKTGDLTDVANWRPVVLLPVMSRILEGALMDQMVNYLESHELLPVTQHAYRKGKSCVSAWEEIDSIVRKARDEGRACAMLMTDLKGAFNCLSKETFLPKLRMAGFSLHSLQLLETYLSNRHNSCKVESITSRPREVLTGVGEGSSAGPIYWLCHVLCSPEVVKRTKRILEDFEDDRHPPHIPILRSSVPGVKGGFEIYEVTFADDENHVLVGDSNEQLLQVMYVLQEEYTAYYKSLGLMESRQKQQHIIWSKWREEGNSYPLNGRPSEDQIRLLGIWCSSDYTFEKQASIVFGKMVARLPHLRKIRDHVSKDVLIRVSRALCLSYVEYGVSIWAGKASIQRKLQRAMNMLLRIITKSSRETSVEKMLKEVNLLNVHLTYQYFCIMGLERLQRTKGSMVTWNLINWNTPRVRFTRYRHLLLNWRPKTSEGWESTIQKSAQFYNRLQLFNTNWWNEEEEPGKALKSWLLANNKNCNL